MTAQAAAAHTAAHAPLRVLLEWTPLFQTVLPPDVQERVEERLKGLLQKRLSFGVDDSRVVCERAAQNSSSSHRDGDTITDGRWRWGWGTDLHAHTDDGQLGPGEWVGMKDL
eukprot:jgi/Hompol1/2633/HPOL_001041-RA